MARLAESEDLKMKVRTNKKRATAITPENTGERTHDATIEEIP